MGRVVARSPHLSFIARYIQKSRSVAARHQSPVGHHGGNSSGIPNVGKWVRAEQYEVGNLAGLDCSQRIQAEVARWLPRRPSNGGIPPRTSSASSSCSPKPGGLLRSGASVPVRMWTPARCIAATCASRFASGPSLYN